VCVHHRRHSLKGARGHCAGLVLVVDGQVSQRDTRVLSKPRTIRVRTHRRYHSLKGTRVPGTGRPLNVVDDNLIEHVTRPILTSSLPACLRIAATNATSSVAFSTALRPSVSVAPLAASSGTVACVDSLDLAAAHNTLHFSQCPGHALSWHCVLQYRTSRYGHRLRLPEVVERHSSHALSRSFLTFPLGSPDTGPPAAGDADDVAPAGIAVAVAGSLSQLAGSEVEKSELVFRWNTLRASNPFILNDPIQVRLRYVSSDSFLGKRPQRWSRPCATHGWCRISRGACACL